MFFFSREGKEGPSDLHTILYINLGILEDNEL